MSWLDAARRSLRGRLALTLTAGSVIVLSLSFIALHMVIRGELYAHVDKDLSLKSRAVAGYAAAHPGSESITEFMPQFRTRAHEDFFQIWDGRGGTLARSDSSAGRDLPRLESFVGKPTYHDLKLPDGHRGRAVSESFALPAGDTRRALTVVMAEEIESLESLESRIHFVLVLVALATIVAMLTISRYSVLRGLRPVDDLARELERVNPEDPQSRLDAGSLPGELRPMAVSFAAVLNRLLDALAREKRYARNVAHELRTPLAEMRLLADVGSSGQDPDAMRAAILDIGVTAAEMERIVDSLLALTRYEAGLESPQPEPIDLCAELRQQVGAMTAAADQHGLTFKLDLPGELWVHADSMLVRRLVANLLGNAIAHTPHGSVVTVRFGPGGELQFINPAPQLVAADVPRLTERFFRISTGNGGSHAGLGLSIAAAIAKVLGLRLELSLQDDGYLVVAISGFRTLDLAGRPG
jgi:two-component system sensor histidine kinase QseC